MAEKMEELVWQQNGFLGIESVGEGLGITVSYWKSLEDIAAWHQNAEHKLAQTNGSRIWSRSFKTRVCKVERDYGFVREDASEAPVAP